MPSEPMASSDRMVTITFQLPLAAAHRFPDILDAALDPERLVSEVAATIEHRCGVRGIGPAVREALASFGLIPAEGGDDAR